MYQCNIILNTCIFICNASSPIIIGELFYNLNNFCVSSSSLGLITTLSTFVNKWLNFYFFDNFILHTIIYRVSQNVRTNTRMRIERGKLNWKAISHFAIFSIINDLLTKKDNRRIIARCARLDRGLYAVGVIATIATKNNNAHGKGEGGGIICHAILRVAITISLSHCIFTAKTRVKAKYYYKQIMQMNYYDENERYLFVFINATHRAYFFNVLIYFLFMANFSSILIIWLD